MRRLKFSRTWFALCVLLCLGAEPGAAFSHDAAWTILSGRGPETERWLYASNMARRAPSRSRPKADDVVVVSAPAPGQGGYVHYFVIEFPDGERETQVGIELPDGRIAWSFPELGVVVSPFIASGEMQAGNHAYPVRYLYGIRPFRSDAAMFELQKDLWRRVIPWVEDATPYCGLTAIPGQPCVSCLGLVLRVLYPSGSGGMPALPRDFERPGAGPVYTTDDLLLYQAGLQGKATPAERMARIDALSLPKDLREDLVHLVQSMEIAEADRPKAEKSSPRRARRSASKATPSRPPTRKML